MAAPKKEPTDDQLKELFTVDVTGLDASNLKKIKAVQKVVTAAAKEVRSLFQGETGNISPIVAGLKGTLTSALTVVKRRAGLVETKGKKGAEPTFAAPPAPPTDGNTGGVARVEGEQPPVIPAAA